MIDILRAENAQLRAETAAQKSAILELTNKINWLTEVLTGNKQKMFGASSEKTAYVDGSLQLELFKDGATEITVFDSTQESSSGKTKKRPIKKSETLAKLPKDFPVETIKCELSEDECICPKCTEKMRAIGKEIVRRSLKIYPARAVVEELEQYSYSCTNGCEKDSGVTGDPVPIIVKAQLPPQIIKGSICTPETLAHIVVEKCIMGSPLYRQEAQWNRLGVPIPRQTMADWVIRCSEHYFEPLYDELHRRLLQHMFLHSDATTFQVLREPGKTPQSESCMWVHRTSGDAKHPIVVYEYQPDKKQERVNTFFRGYSGYLMTDGAVSYRRLPDEVIIVGCFSHCRRYFHDALKTIKSTQEQKGSLALIGKEYCDKLFDIERDIKDMSFEQRYAARTTQAAPILSELYAWLLSVQPYVAPKSKIGKAVDYALRQWKYLERYLLDGRIEISNNRCERSVKPFVINRKNFLFAVSTAGAKATAVFHTITETAKESGLNPFEYISHVLHTAAGIDLKENPALVNMLLPENAPESCKVATL